MTSSRPFTRELSLAVRFAAVSLVGFAVDALGLKFGLAAGLGAEVSRVASLLVALQVTFFLSRSLVFNHNAPGTLRRDWWRFMIANSFGSFCNLAIFVGMTRAPWPDLPDPWPDPSAPWVALLVSASVAYVINYVGTRLFVYGRTLSATATKSPGPGA
jgi:putative flippase GtrA